MKKRVKPRAERKQREIQSGVTLDASGAELMARIAERIKWHRKQASTVDAEIKRLLVEPAADTRDSGGWRRNSTMTDLGRRLREHQERGDFLDVRSAAPVGGTIYRLHSGDLRMMEIMPETFHWW